MLVAPSRRDAERRRGPPPPELRQGCGASGRIPRSARRLRRDDRCRPPGRSRRDPEDAREARRGLRPRLRLEDATERPVPRRLFSRVFNWTTGAISGVHLHDVNCGLKAYRAEVLQGMRLYGELHRFIPVLAAYRGFRIAEIPVNHRAAPARPLALRPRALPARVLRPPQRHLHGPLPAPAAASVRRRRRAHGRARLRHPPLPHDAEALGPRDRTPPAPDARRALARRRDPVRLARPPLGARHVPARGADDERERMEQLVDEVLR